MFGKAARSVSVEDMNRAIRPLAAPRHDDWPDTNVLVRYIMQDDVKRSPKPPKTDRLAHGRGAWIVSLVSVVELLVGLSSSYGPPVSRLPRRWSCC